MRYAVKVFDHGKVFFFKTFGTRSEADYFKNTVVSQTNHDAVVYKIELTLVEEEYEEA
ncbi:gp116 (endogenous virus) [Lactococcus phage KSY1]|uniref:Gp116 n=1 Tax=Lactococcus phage KSY1 TaxID=2913972 RepID=A6MAI1_9CAUD|nr:gp116 [Lactococcus phage KSY1]ABG21659.1 gp116 [Lactococcus phage KSY1]